MELQEPSGAARAAIVLESGTAEQQREPGLALPSLVRVIGTQRQLLTAVLLVAAVLIPLLMLTRVSINTPINFDGAMNLQAADGLDDGHSIARDYGGWHVFPTEVQTSGAFLFVAAGSLRVLGEDQLGYQLPSLLFALILLGAVSWAVRANLAARVLAPGLVFLGLPDIAHLGIGALGEIPVAALALLAFALVAHVAGGARRPFATTALAFGLAGVAISIKVVAVAIVPVMLLGLLVVLIARPELSRRRLAAASAALVAAPAAFELYRLVSLGSLGAYRTQLRAQIRDVGYQSGSGDTLGAHAPSFLEKARHHLHLLSGETLASEPVLIAYLVVPLVLLAWLIVRNRRSLRSFLADRTVALAVMLSAYGGVYFLWWLLVTPTEKAWLRRILIGFVAINVLYALLAVVLARRAAAPPVGRPGAPPRAVSIGALALLAAAGFAFAGPIVHREGDRMLSRDDRDLRSLQHAAKAVRAGTPAHRYFGDGWWSAPDVSLVAETPLGNLAKVDLCSLDPRRDVLVWNSDAQAIIGAPDDRGGRLRLRKVAEYGGSAAFYSVGPARGACRTS